MKREVDRDAGFLLDDKLFQGVFRDARRSALTAATDFVESQKGVKIPRVAASLRVLFDPATEDKKVHLARYKTVALKDQMDVTSGRKFELTAEPCYSCGYSSEWIFDPAVFEQLDVVRDCDARYDKLPGYSCPERQSFIGRGLGKFEILLKYVPVGEGGQQHLPKFGKSILLITQRSPYQGTTQRTTQRTTRFFKAGKSKLSFLLGQTNTNSSRRDQ